MAFRKQRMGRKKVCYFTKNKITYMAVKLKKSCNLLYNKKKIQKGIEKM